MANDNLDRKSELDDNFMEEFANFKAPPFTHCTASLCDLSSLCQHKTFSVMKGDLFKDLKNGDECSNFYHNPTIKYKIKVK